MYLMRRSLLAMLLLSLLTVSLANHTGRTLRMAVTQDEGSLTPYTYHTGYPGYELMTLIYDTLFLNDEERTVQPWLAESVELVNEVEYHITLRDNLSWQDGEPLTASDVVFTINYFRENLWGRFTTHAEDIAEATAPDERTIIINLPGPDPTFLERALGDLPILPEHVWAEVTEPREMGMPMGSGPYLLAEYRTEQFYRFEENPNFWGPPPAFDVIIAPIIRDQTATFQALQAGEIDVAVRVVPPELVNLFEGRQDVAIAQGPLFASTILLMNTEEGALASAELRQVIAGLINYDRLVNTLLLGYATPGTPGFLHPDHPLAAPEAREYTLLSPDEARERLSELGYESGADGVWVDAEGNRLEFELLAQSENPIRVRAAELIAQDLNAAGIRVNVRAMESQALDAQVWPEFDVTLGRNYEMSMFGWSAPVNALARVRDLLHSDTSVGRLNLSGYANPEVDELADRAATATQPDERQALMADLQVALAEALPLITLFFQDGIYAYRPAAYDNWVFMIGQGIINKRSFVQE